MATGGGYNRYDELASKLLDGTITDSEKQEYMEWLNKEDGKDLKIPQSFASDEQELKKRIFARLNSNISRPAVVVSSDQQPSVNIDTRKWWRNAAAAVILLTLSGSAAYLWINHKTDEKTLANAYKPVTGDALPGRDGAVLTLADGLQLVLDSLGNGVIATQGKTTVLIRNGQLVYNALREGKEIMYNTMTTPKGRQYQLVLPDGSKVWLNAASSITYPAAFIGQDRNVRITGEAYFEVTKDKEKPFIVDVDGKSTVRVLGTSFNINSYVDDGNIKTTLLEGSVKITQGQSVVLKPGQQAQQSENAEKITVNAAADIEQVMAWKNGSFQFNETSLQLVLKQLERWYDIDVVFEGKVPNETFIGELPRNAPLSQILRVLAKTQVQFRIEGKKLIVSGD